MIYTIFVTTETLPSANPAWNLFLFIWKEISAQLSSCSPRSRYSPCTSVFSGLSVNANNGDLDRCVTGKVGSLNVIVSFPPETIQVLEPLIHQINPLCTSDIQTYPTVFLQCYGKAQDRKSISNDPSTVWKKSIFQLQYRVSQIQEGCMFLPSILSKGHILKDNQVLYTANCPGN